MTFQSGNDYKCVLIQMIRESLDSVCVSVFMHACACAACCLLLQALAQNSDLRERLCKIHIESHISEPAILKNFSTGSLQVGVRNTPPPAAPSYCPHTSIILTFHKELMARVNPFHRWNMQQSWLNPSAALSYCVQTCLETPTISVIHQERL